MFVIARNSTFTYKGQPVDVKQVGRELGVRYVLEGSVRKAGQKVRITGQLIDAPIILPSGTPKRMYKRSLSE
jgi:adenylate cyclase